jgi:hypothetical protein
MRQLRNRARVRQLGGRNGFHERGRLEKKLVDGEWKHYCPECVEVKEP